MNTKSNNWLKYQNVINIKALLQTCLQTRPSHMALATMQFEAEILLADVLQQSRVFLRAHPETQVSATQAQEFKSRFEKRLQGVPIAYLIHQKEFYSFPFYVDDRVLIPRPETELLIEEALQLCAAENASVLELGTGSGCIAITLAKLRPTWKITAIDVSSQALQVAERNAALHGTSIDWIQSDWFENVKAQHFDLIISNPPYLEKDDTHLHTDIRFEPRGALVSGTTGLEAYEAIVPAGISYLKPQGWLLLEHGYNQQDAIITLLQQQGYSNIQGLQDLNGIPRVVRGSSEKWLHQSDHMRKLEKALEWANQNEPSDNFDAFVKDKK